MATAKTYQDLICWQLADQLEQMVFEFTETGPVSKDFKFRDQIRDSSSSSTRCMAEGFGRFWPKEHAALLRIGKASLFETHNPRNLRKREVDKRESRRREDVLAAVEHVRHGC